jgi:Phage Connector (GP10).
MTNLLTANPAVFIDKDLYGSDGELQMAFINKDVKTSYIITDLLNDIKSLDDMFNTEIGIPNANTEKRERMLVDEINANNFETRSKAQIWLENLQRGCGNCTWICSELIYL